jgi:hypothetical protein
MVRSATQRLGSGPRNLFGSGAIRTHSKYTLERSSRSPRGCHSPRGLGGCLTTSTLHPRCSSIHSLSRRPCIPDRPIDGAGEGILRSLLQAPVVPLRGPAGPPREHPGFEHQPQRIHQKMALSSTQFLRPIVSAYAPNALVVFTYPGYLQDPGARLRIATST